MLSVIKQSMLAVKKLGFVSILFFAVSHKLFAFGQDLCFHKPESAEGKTLISNCIDIPRKCRNDQLSFSELQYCKTVALKDALQAMFGPSSSVIGGRSMVHMDSTYYLAQLIGFKAEEAYQIAIYDEAADAGQYKAFNQQGLAILTKEEIQQCAVNKSDKKCLLITPVLSGITKFNSKTGGMLFHLPARYANQPTPPLTYPTNYLLTPDLEKYIANLRDWAFGKYHYACVGGITDKDHRCVTSSESNPVSIHGHIPFFATDIAEAVKVNAVLGEQIINEANADQSTPTVYSSQIDAYVSPHRGDLAKLGLFLHSFQDRYSHHKCSDVSYIAPAANGYEAHFDSKACAQGIHMLSHGWEAGTNQSHSNLKQVQDRTIEPALSMTYDQLLAYAQSHGIKVKQNLNKKAILDELLEVLSIEDPVKRLNAMVSLFEKKGLMPLPEHGMKSQVAQ